MQILIMRQKYRKRSADFLRAMTVVMIAHRLSSVTNADRIFVLKDGEIEESGTHESLEKANGLYAHMWEKYNQSVCWKVGV